jgi:hypothetical protein
MLPTPIMSTEMLESCAEASETRAAKISTANKTRFIMRRIWAPSPHRSRGESEQQTGGGYAARRLRYRESARAAVVLFGLASSSPLAKVMLVSRQVLFKGLLRYRWLVSSEQKENEAAADKGATIDSRLLGGDSNLSAQPSATASGSLAKRPLCAKKGRSLAPH